MRAPPQDLTAPVVVWDYERRRQIFNLFGITQQVTSLAFSPDDQFLAAAGADNLLFVWDMQVGAMVVGAAAWVALMACWCPPQTGEQLVGKKCAARVTFLNWAPVVDTGRRPMYRLCFAFNQQMKVATLRYEVRSMRYAMVEEAFALPSSGFVRDYFVGFCSGDSLCSGTAAGEFSVFSLTSKVYRASVRVSTNGVLSIAGQPHTGVIYVGSGDGVVQSFRGSDSTWTCEGQAQLMGRVVSLSLSADASFLLAGTSAGMMYVLCCRTVQLLLVTRLSLWMAYGVVVSLPTVTKSARRRWTCCPCRKATPGLSHVCPSAHAPTCSAVAVPMAASASGICPTTACSRIWMARLGQRVPRVFCLMRRKWYLAGTTAACVATVQLTGYAAAAAALW